MTYEQVLRDGVWLSPREAASRLAVTTKTLQRWGEAGHITVMVLPSKHRRYLRADVDAIVDERPKAS